MAFSCFTCWDIARISEVMNTEALQVSDQVFLATHHPMRMARVTSRNDARVGTVLTEEQFLNEFMSPNEDHMHSAVLGTAGAGKSHLIRWLYLNIPRTNSQRIVLIPKVGTNLRRVLELILEDMEGDVFDRYRERLQRATGDLPIERAKLYLLANLAIATGPQGPRSQERPDDEEVQLIRDFLIESMPILLHQPAISERLLVKDGIIEQIAKHAIGDTERERREKRRAFGPNDLALEDWGINPNDLAQEAREPYQMLYNNYDGMREQALAWLNANLDWAISRLLDLGSDDMSQLMLEVREVLAQQEKELILLIEDFAKLQGIDNQLLEALLMRPVQYGRRLCRLRAAMAVTAGYYDSLPDTVKDRINLAVDVDISLQEQELQDGATGEFLARFSSRYLNAVRLSPAELRDWEEQRATGQGMQTAFPNHCDRCEDKQACHTAFGECQGFGLYPFTRQALSTIYKRAEKVHPRATTVSLSAFNPRLLINEVLKHPLTLPGDIVRQGKFPPYELLMRLGGGEMPVMSVQQLERRINDSSRRDQYRALIELWGSPQHLDSVPSDVLTAFGLPALTGTTTPIPPPPRRDPSPVPQPTPVTQQPILEVSALDTWANGGTMVSGLTQALRELLFPSLQEYIDWNAEMLVSSFYAGQSKVFRQSCIIFEGQQTSGGTRGEAFTIQVKRSNENAIALQGVLQAKVYGHWNFDGGQFQFRQFARLMRELACETIRKIRKLPTEDTEFDPVPVAVELLTLGGQLIGKPTADHQSEIEARFDALFIPWDTIDLSAQTEHRSREWLRLLKAFQDFGGKISEIMMSRIACTKGGTIAAQVIDAAQILPVLKLTRQSDRPSLPLPETLRVAYQPLIKLRERIDQYYDEAISIEQVRYLQWRDTMRRYFPANESVKEVLDLLKQVAALSSGVGVFGLRNFEDLNQALSFRASSFEECLRIIDDRLAANENRLNLPILGRTDFFRPMAAGNTFVSTVSQFLEGTQKRLKTEEEGLWTFALCHLVSC